MSLRTASLAAALMLAAPAAALGAPQTEIVETAPARAPATESQRYADREAQDKHVQDYEGGNTVVITMSGTALVVLLVLLLLL